jgi:hypothetical protein
VSIKEKPLEREEENVLQKHIFQKNSFQATKTMRPIFKTNKGLGLIQQSIQPTSIIFPLIDSTPYTKIVG